jgi:hypothetical protein
VERNLPAAAIVALRRSVVISSKIFQITRLVPAQGRKNVHEKVAFGDLLQDGNRLIWR